ncbi:MAG TPA: hypothetical protein VKH81_22910 [Candidatus Angelobacter sp.]|nr:hypothetical protein [Candidatus Angelobacter sp.]
MTEPLKPAWSTPLPENFELREFATGVLEIAKENLQRDQELVSTAFAITAAEIQCYSVVFSDHDEKAMVYQQLIETARRNGATALITCNDAFIGEQATPDFLESYYPGKLKADGAQECIMLAISGPAIQTWVIEVPYERTGDKIEFGRIREEIGGELGFLEGWASEEPEVQ